TRSPNLAGARIPVSRGTLSLQRPRQVSLCVRLKKQPKTDGYGRGHCWQAHSRLRERNLHPPGGAQSVGGGSGCFARWSNSPAFCPASGWRRSGRKYFLLLIVPRMECISLAHSCETESIRRRITRKSDGCGTRALGTGISSSPKLRRIKNRDLRVDEQWTSIQTRSTKPFLLCFTSQGVTSVLALPPGRAMIGTRSTDCT